MVAMRLSSRGLHFDSVAWRFTCTVYLSVDWLFLNVVRKYLCCGQYSMHVITDDSSIIRWSERVSECEKLNIT